MRLFQSPEDLKKWFEEQFFLALEAAQVALLWKQYQSAQSQKDEDSIYELFEKEAKVLHEQKWREHLTQMLSSPLQKNVTALGVVSALATGIAAAGAWTGYSLFSAPKAGLPNIPVPKPVLYAQMLFDLVTRGFIAAKDLAVEMWQFMVSAFRAASGWMYPALSSKKASALSVAV